MKNSELLELVGKKVSFEVHEDILSVKIKRSLVKLAYLVN